MDFRDRFIKISHFLQDHHDLWSSEVLNRHTSPLADWAEEAAQHLKNYSFSELADFDSSMKTKDNLPDGLKLIIQEIKELTTLPSSVHSESSVDPLLKGERNLTPKKTHEIHQLGEVLYLQNGEAISDIGGGVGHVSLYLHRRFGITSTIYDRDKKLNSQGKARLEKYHPKSLGPIAWIEGTLNDQNWPRNNQFTIGLHSCGPLSLSVLKNACAGINVGCCYHLLTDQFNLSVVAKSNPINFTPHALGLASKKHYLHSENDVKLRYEVKHHRYLLHLYLEQFQPDKINTIFGTLPREEYRRPFAEYALSEMEKHHIKSSASEIELDIFAEKYKLQFAAIFLKDFVRGLFARVLEVGLILDRAMWCQEMGKEVELREIFDSTISPRNLAIIFK